MPGLHQQRCFNHAAREAAARCLECQRFFCRECVTEHEDRLVCATCLRKPSQPGKATSWSVWPLFCRAGQALSGLIIAWMFFHLVATLLMKIPSSFHEGAVWKAKYWE